MTSYVVYLCFVYPVVAQSNLVKQLSPMPNITTYEASKRSGLTVGYIRQLLAKGKLKGRLAPINKSKSVWLVDPESFKKYLSLPRQRGPKPKKKQLFLLVTYRV